MSVFHHTLALQATAYPVTVRGLEQPQQLVDNQTGYSRAILSTLSF